MLTCEHCTSLAFSNLSSLHQFEFIHFDFSKLQNQSNPDSFTICDCTLIIIIGISKTFNDLNWFIPPVWRTRNKFMLRFGHDRSINSFGCRVLGFRYWTYIPLPKRKPSREIISWTWMRIPRGTILLNTMMTSINMTFLLISRIMNRLSWKLLQFCR